MTDPRAVRYRRLALAEQEPERAHLLNLLADEAERGILFTATPRKPAAKLPDTRPATTTIPLGR